MRIPRPSTRTAGGPISRRPVWIRLVSIAALLVLGSCAVVWLMVPRRAHTASLVSSSGWALATALPASESFPAGWGYKLYGMLGPSTPPNTPPSTRTDCGPATTNQDMPTLGLGVSAAVGVDVNLPAQDSQAGHKARYRIYAVPDPVGLILRHLQRLDRCGTPYSLTKAHHVDTRAPDGADFGVQIDSRQMYYVVRGVALTCITNMDGDDLALIRRLTAQSVRELRAL